MARRDTAPPGYDPGAFPPFAVTVDLVVFTVQAGRLRVLLVERGAAPFEGRLALPGGFVQIAESLDDAARRELAEETGVELTDVGPPEQLATYGDPDRDPRMRVVSTAYVALLPEVPEPRAGSDAADAVPVDVDEALEQELAFDHHRILVDGVERVRGKLEYTSIATRFCGREFTLSELRAVYEAVWGEALDPGNFRRKILASDVVEEIAYVREPGPGGGRPAQLYRAASTATVSIDPPIRRP